MKQLKNVKANLMNVIIRKFPIAWSEGQAVVMPSGAEILSVQFHANEICLWAKVWPTNANVNRTIFIVGDSQAWPAGDFTEFVGTVQVGAAAWHIIDGGVRE